MSVLPPNGLPIGRERANAVPLPERHGRVIHIGYFILDGHSPHIRRPQREARELDSSHSDRVHRKVVDNHQRFPSSDAMQALPMRHFYHSQGERRSRHISIHLPVVSAKYTSHVSLMSIS